MQEDDTPGVTVAHSRRMADTGKPDDVVYGKRFTDPATGRPASIVDILVASGMLRPEPRPDPDARGEAGADAT